MKTVLIVYHSMTGATLAVAQAALSGARGESEVRAVLLHASIAGPEHVLAASGYLFATPENLGSMAGLMKDFFDRTYYAALDRVNGRPYATLVCAGSDGRGAVQQVERIATGWRLKPIAPALIVPTHAQTPTAIQAPKQVAAAALAECTALGATLASGLAFGIY